MPSERDIINESYILRESVGEDAFAEWWRASSIYHASNYLVRFVKDRYSADDAARDPFLRLAKGRIDSVSPSILGLVEVGRHAGRPFLVSEYEEHRNLRSILDSGRRFSVEHACRLSIALAEGVDSFHQRGEAYGAISPESVVVHQSGGNIDEIKLLLPGYESFFGTVPTDSAADFVSSWGYASPELKKGKSSSARSDLYSLGVLLFRLLIGKLPYGSRSGIKVRDRSASPSHVAAALARRGMPMELAAAVVRSLRRNPELRHADALSFITELRAILDVRREAWIRAGKVDPIAELATLNLKKAKADAKEIVRSLETVNYFRFIADSGSESEWKPIETIEADEKTLELEEAEAERDDDDDSIATDAYVEAGYRAAGEPRRSKTQRVPLAAENRENAESALKTSPPTAKAEAPLTTLEPAGVPKRSAPAQAPSPVAPPASYWTAASAPSPKKPSESSTARPPLNSAEVESKTRNPSGGSASTEALRDTRIPAPAEPGAAGSLKPAAMPPEAMPQAAKLLAEVPARPGSPIDNGVDDNAVKRRSPPIYWKPSGGSPDEVVEKMAAAVEKAKAGTGLVRFIEAPATAAAAKVIAEGLDSLRAGSELFDIGALEPGLTLDRLVSDVVACVQWIKLAPLGQSSRRNSRTGSKGENAAVPPKMKRIAAETAVALASGASLERPLVLIARGASSVSPSAHEFFVALAKEAIHAPLCAFLFFGPGPIPAWHVLAAVKHTRR